MTSLLVGLALLAAEPLPKLSPDALTLVNASLNAKWERLQEMEAQQKQLKAEGEFKKAKDLAKEIKEFRKPETRYWARIGRSQPLQIGDVGFPYSQRVTVRQIIGPTEMLVDRGYLVAGTRSQYVGGKRVLIPVPDTVYQPMLVRGVQTGGYSDDTEATILGAVKVTENFTYTTAIGGSKTVLVLEPYDNSEADAAWDAYAKAWKPPKPEKKKRP